jgi:hypothetical protein
MSEGQEGGGGGNWGSNPVLRVVILVLIYLAINAVLYPLTGWIIF